jgi:hypothetical protein
VAALRRPWPSGTALQLGRQGSAAWPQSGPQTPLRRCHGGWIAWKISRWYLLRPHGSCRMAGTSGCAQPLAAPNAHACRPNSGLPSSPDGCAAIAQGAARILPASARQSASIPASCDQGSGPYVLCQRGAQLWATKGSADCGCSLLNLPRWRPGGLKTRCCLTVALCRRRHSADTPEGGGNDVCGAGAPAPIRPQATRVTKEAEAGSKQALVAAVALEWTPSLTDKHREGSATSDEDHPRCGCCLCWSSATAAYSEDCMAEGGCLKAGVFEAASSSESNVQNHFCQPIVDGPLRGVWGTAGSCRAGARGRACAAAAARSTSTSCACCTLAPPTRPRPRCTARRCGASSRAGVAHRQSCSCKLVSEFVVRAAICLQGTEVL